MEIACALPSHLFPTKGVGCRSTNFSDFSLLPQSLSRTGRYHKERREVTAAPKKRKHSGEENPPEKKQKKTTEASKPKPKIDESRNQGFRDLIAKAREKVEEKRQIDHRNTEIARQRLASRLALNQVVATVAFDDHLKYHTELQELGCDFIRDRVSCLNMFSLLSRSDYSVLEKK
ncbi:unnamed protein product [Microthlaspi erraticum]|uniref:Uncharacterized protein n=1 Tax=Microthlaspi erraticum TaxID=1685480 RepID=A0A6D2K3Z2_9BRAS|nr:unnamed protein product [Microthlaspi erraticum]